MLEGDTVTRVADEARPTVRGPASVTDDGLKLLSPAQEPATSSPPRASGTPAPGEQVPVPPDSVTEQSVVVPPVITTVPVGVPVNSGLTVAVKLSAERLPEVTLDGETTTDVVLARVTVR